MPEPIANSPNQLPDEPELRRQEREPKGVLRKNLKPLLYLGAALLVIVAAIFSGTGKKTPAQKGQIRISRPSRCSRTAPTTTCRISKTRSPQHNRRRRNRLRIRCPRQTPRSQLGRPRSKPQLVPTAQRVSQHRAFPASRAHSNSPHTHAAAAFPGSPGGTAARRQRP
jgi:hypothetical protein